MDIIRGRILLEGIRYAPFYLWGAMTSQATTTSDTICSYYLGGAPSLAISIFDIISSKLYLGNKIHIYFHQL